MSFTKKLLSAGAAAALISGAASAQIVPIDYSHNWQPMHDVWGNGIIVSDFDLFAPTGFVQAPFGAGDTIRRCLGTDSTQGGRNQSTGNAENTWFRLCQGYGPGSTAQAAEAGLFIMSMATDSDPANSDVCFSPWLPSASNAGGHKTALIGQIGAWGGTGAPIPTFWFLIGQWGGTTTTNFQGVPGPATVGNQVAPFNPVNPLLSNTIFELQGPVNGTNRQYYIATTAELTGLGGSDGVSTPATFGTGGVTNGNSSWGSGIYGVDAALSGAVNHTRITAFDDPAQGGSGFIAFINLVPQTEVIMNAAFQTPTLWGSNNGNEGAGGNDWVASTSPVSTIDLRVMDNLSAGQINPAAAAFNPGIVFSKYLFVWSGTSAAGMVEKPMSWDDLGTPALPAQAGSIILGPQFMSREGAQTIPANFDLVTSTLLGFGGLTLSTDFNPATDPFLDGAVAAHFFEGITGPIVEGSARLSGGAQPVVGAAKPGLAGVKLGVAAIGVQVDAGAGTIGPTEVASSLEINLQ